MVTARQFQAKLRGSGLIYYITTVSPEFPIKIGLSNEASLPARFRQLQTALPYKVAALHIHAGSADEEAELHDRFSKAHLRGEWFERTPDLRHHLHNLRKSDPDWHTRYAGIPKGVAIHKTGDTNA